MEGPGEVPAVQALVEHPHAQHLEPLAVTGGVADDSPQRPGVGEQLAQRRRPLPE